MDVLRTMLGCLLVVALQGTASAQIYESKDAEGVTEFSDEPTAGAEEVELGSTNVVTPTDASPAPEPMQPSQEQSGSTGVAAGGTGGEEARDPDYIYYGGDEDELGPRAQRREDADIIENRPPREVDGEPREEAVRQVEVARPDGAGEMGHPVEGGEAHHAGGRR